MSEKSSKLAEKKSGNPEMPEFTAPSISEEMRDRLQRAMQRASGFSIKERLSFGAQSLGLSFARARAIWYDEVKRYDYAEVERVRQRAQWLEQRQIARQDAIHDNEMAELRERLARLEARLEHLDATHGAVAALASGSIPPSGGLADRESGGAGPAASAVTRGASGGRR